MNGSQNNTIQGNSITLNRSYSNTFGIYSNTNHNETVPTVQALITNITGSNSYNKVYSNIISSVNLGIAFIGSSDNRYHDLDNDIGGSLSTTGNTITIRVVHLYKLCFDSRTSYCIFSNHQKGENISNNIIDRVLTILQTFMAC